MGEVRSDPATDAASSDAPSRDDELAGALRTLTGQVEQLRDELGRLIQLRLDRLRLGLVEGGFRLLGWIWLAAVLAAVTVVAGIQVVHGINGALAALLGGRAWAGDLAGGLLVLAVVGLTLIVIRAARRRRQLTRLQSKYRRPDEAEVPR